MRIRILGPVLVWLTAVVSVAAIAWFAINAAGEQVIANPIAPSLVGAPIVPTDPGEVETAAASPTVGRPTGTSKSIPKSTLSRPSVTPTPGSSELAITQEHALVAVESTYSTEAGRVRVRCNGAQITLDGGYAQPVTGWSVQVRDGGPDQVRVRFDQSGQRALLIVATCVDRRPRFEQTWLDRSRDGDSGDRDNADDVHDGEDSGAGPVSSESPTR